MCLTRNIYVSVLIHTKKVSWPTRLRFPLIYFGIDYQIQVLYFFTGVNWCVWLDTGWQRPIGCRIFKGHFPQKNPILSGSFAGNDQQVFAALYPWFSFVNSNVALDVKNLVKSDEKGCGLCLVGVFRYIGLFRHRIRLFWHTRTHNNSNNTSASSGLYLMGVFRYIGLFWHECISVFWHTRTHNASASSGSCLMGVFRFSLVYWGFIIYTWEVATMSRLLKIIGLFCRI